MASPVTLADALKRGDPAALATLDGALIRPRKDNFVPRPWGGHWLPGFKGCRPPDDGQPLGESFEISAWRSDAEAEQYPSRIVLADGSEIALTELLGAAGDRVLGHDFHHRFPEGFPLLPKLLDIKELLSVQGHPSGCTEVYVVIQADPGATLRLGFARALDRDLAAQRLKAGLALQRRLIEVLPANTDLHALQAAFAPWLAGRPDADLPPMLVGAEARRIAQELHQVYWWMLDQMNEIPVEPGQVILNANPARVLAGTNRVASAEVHALGNPEQREILALEVRMPGPTFRAWDNVRFPQRQVDVDAALDSLSLEPTRPEEFLMERQPQPHDPHWMVSVDIEDFRVEHLRADPGDRVLVGGDGFHTLHVLRGQVTIDSDESPGQRLAQGESAIVPASMGGYCLCPASDAEVVRVTSNLY